MKEVKIEDIIGKFISPLTANEKRFIDAKWVPGRIILSNKNIWLIGKDRKKKIPLGSIFNIGGRLDLNEEIARTPIYLLIKHYGPEKERYVSLITSSKRQDLEKFKTSLLELLLNRKIVLIKYPVKKGGVVQRNVKWEKAQVAVKNNKIRIVTESGKLVKIDLDKIQLVKKDEREVNQEMKTVLDVQFSEIEDGMEFTVECYIHAKEETLNALQQFIYNGFDRVAADIQLSDVEKQIIMSLYTGVSPFEIPNFLGLDVDEVEEIYDRLIKLGVLKEVRKRKEVVLTTRGKNLASEALGSE